MPKPKKVNFEKSLDQLEALVREMESGELTLEQSLRAFENGIKLSRECQLALDEAEQKVQLLLQENGEARAVDFHSDGDDEA